jgi:uncharacterized protein YpiB (UPF0302 family)
MTPVETVDCQLNNLRSRYLAAVRAGEMDLGLKLLKQIDEALDKRNDLKLANTTFVPWVRRLLA